MGARRGNNPEYEEEHRIHEIERGIHNALTNTVVYGNEHSLRIWTIRRAINFDPKTGNILDNAEVQCIRGSKFRAIIDGREFLPNSAMRLDVEKSCLRNIKRFDIESLMVEDPVVFSFESESILADDTSPQSL